jgi:hypothetical protein
MSTWLYNTAIHDSKKEVDIEIRKRRAQKIKSAAEAAQIRALQAMVDLRPMLRDLLMQQKCWVNASDK